MIIGIAGVSHLQALLNTPLNSKVTNRNEKDGIVAREVMFHSEMDVK